MKLKLLKCDADRPDKRAITKCITDISFDNSTSEAVNFTEILLEGDPIEIEIEDSNSATSLRSLRKLQIDYEIVE